MKKILLILAAACFLAIAIQVSVWEYRSWKTNISPSFFYIFRDQTVKWNGLTIEYPDAVYYKDDGDYLSFYRWDANTSGVYYVEKRTRKQLNAIIGKCLKDDSCEDGSSYGILLPNGNAAPTMLWKKDDSMVLVALYPDCEVAAGYSGEIDAFDPFRGIRIYQVQK